MTITEFLEARIAEDEADCAPDPDWDDYAGHCDAAGPHYSLARSRAECAAKRAILNEHELAERSDGARTSTGCVLCNYNRDYGWEEVGPCKTLRAIASVYAEYSDYRQEWKL